MQVTISAAPSSMTPDAPTKGAQPGDLKDVAWKKDVEKLLNDALDILKNQAQDEVIDVAQHIEMALKALSYEPDMTDAEAMMGSKKDPMSAFGTAEDQPKEEN